MGKRVLKRSRWGTKRVDELTQEDVKKALEVFGKRPPRSQKIDKRYAGKVPAFFETWLRHPERYDLPGVDLGTVRRSSKRKNRGKEVTKSETSGSFKTKKPASVGKKKTYKATVTVGYSCTKSRYCVYYSVFLVSRDGKVMSLSEGEGKGIVKVVKKDWYVSSNKKYGDFVIEVPEDWIVIQRYSGDKEDVEVITPEGVKVKPYKKVVHAKVAKGRKVVDIVEEGYRVGGLLIPTYFRLKDREFDYPLSLFDGRIVEECSSLKECKNLVIKRKVRMAVGEGRTVVADLRKGLKVFTVNLPKGYKAVFVFGDTYPIRNELKSLGMRFSRDTVMDVGVYMKRMAGESLGNIVFGVSWKMFNRYLRRIRKYGLGVPEKGSLQEENLKLLERIIKEFKKKGVEVPKEAILDYLFNYVYYGYGGILNDRHDRMFKPKYVSGWGYGLWTRGCYEDKKECVEKLMKKLKEAGKEAVLIERLENGKKELILARIVRDEKVPYITTVGWYRVFTPADIKAGEYEEFKKGLRKLFRGGGK